MDEILFIDKPKGITSFSVIRALRKKLKIKKIGHAGTLDPIASGLLIVGIGRATKRLNDYLNLPKVYQMEILLGKKTDTGDLQGRVIEEKEVKEVNEGQLKKCLSDLQGIVELPIPAYSAVKYRGRPLYQYARKGIKLEPRFRKTEIFYLKLIEILKEGKSFALKIEMKCQKGTYARSVAEEIGNRLSLPATIRELRRIQVGDINISCAKTLEQV